MTHKPLPTGRFCDWPSDEKKRLYGLIVDGHSLDKNSQEGSGGWIFAGPRFTPHQDSTHHFRLALTKDTLSPALKEVLRDFNWVTRDEDGRKRAYTHEPKNPMNGEDQFYVIKGDFICLHALHGYTVGTIPWDQSLQRIHDEPE